MFLVRQHPETWQFNSGILALNFNHRKGFGEERKEPEEQKNWRSAGV